MNPKVVSGGFSTISPAACPIQGTPDSLLASLLSIPLTRSGRSTQPDPQFADSKRPRRQQGSKWKAKAQFRLPSFMSQETAAECSSFPAPCFFEDFSLNEMSVATTLTSTSRATRKPKAVPKPPRKRPRREKEPVAAALEPPVAEEGALMALTDPKTRRKVQFTVFEEKELPFLCGPLHKGRLIEAERDDDIETEEELIASAKRGSIKLVKYAVKRFGELGKKALQEIPQKKE